MPTSNRSSAGLATAFLLATPLAAGLALAVWGLADSPLDSGAPAEAVIASVESAQRRDNSTVTATFTDAESFGVKTQSSGTVTSLALATAREPMQGTVAMEVDGKPVTAYVAAAPLYRDIAREMEGSDVVTAQRLLVDLGYLDGVDGVDGKAGYATERAIKAFNKDHGYGDANATLAASSLLWIPDSSDAPAALSVRVGDMLSPGLELYTTSTGTASYILNLEPTKADRVVTLNDLTIELPAGMTQITDAEAVAALKERLVHATNPTVAVSLAEPRTVGTIPASAIISDADGTVCFFPGMGGDPIQVDLGSGSTGLVDVDPELIGQSVIVNPREVMDAPTCGS